MRVITGTAKGIRLEAVEGETTRPILDRVKESLFSIIANRVPGSNVMDIFAGTGALGIETLSRGATACLFVDNDNDAVKIIGKNLEKTHLAYKSSIIKADVLSLDTNKKFVSYLGRDHSNQSVSGINVLNDSAQYQVKIPLNKFKRETSDMEIHVTSLDTAPISPETIRKFDIIFVGAPYHMVEQVSAREELLMLLKRLVEKQITATDGIIVLQHRKENFEISKELYKVETIDTRVYGKTQLTFLKPCITLVF